MDIEKLIDAKSEFTDSKHPPEPIVMMTRVRLARNLAEYPFPGWATEEELDEVLHKCESIVKALPEMKGGRFLECDSLSDLDKQVLVERHLISNELADEEFGAGVGISKDQSIAILVNEEDHLRIQVVQSGFRFDPVWKILDKIDSELEDKLNYAFSDDLGYLTACPTNLGTALRGSVMMHLPGLVMMEQMEKVIRASNQLGLAVRGIFGEGSEANGSIFQVSNQQTLGESEKGILQRLSGVLQTIVEQEKNARKRLLAQHSKKLFDKIGRAYGILRNGYVVNSGEAMNLLSLIRLGVDYGAFPEKYRKMVDRLFLETHPAHLQVSFDRDISQDERDALRAYLLRDKFKSVPKPDFDSVKP